MSALLMNKSVASGASLKASTRSVGRITPAPARRSVAAQAAREMWYPGATPPAHLDGSMLGDYGFDPLRLGTNPDRMKWFREAELTNGRWAMAAVVGILFTDLVGLPKWWEAGAQTYPIDNQTLAIIEIAVFAFLEAKRYEGYKKTGGTGFAFFFPFDPMGMRSPEKELKELKNGRLAMLAFLGFASTAAVNGQGPIESLQTHLADPAHNNIFTSSVGKESCVFVAVLSVLPIIIEATKTLGKGKESVPLFPWNEEWEKVAK
uniref:Lhca2 n=1 Tax=Dunaliella tertiolecta TaxID=3047 RepID=A0AC62AEM4_DUNTE|mmetsp:Transcript_4751/g.13011  ORF Transcript_4751/g.13011 Transcript_4751/m.13011 type:complete len:262 (+) Transcript_4751:104-889(+)|eukprot:CAMPEP_0202337528 /NCGR_PEP_ID=MMETSP1126-20121109/176_1 /ASSEMBLY_ACC=CAM_ASM_000457 /TAXON_ID=3047 /ORGANISM="Dunaliella tertiolecta, Strain CCMP1320" /LENGTH=261 /DNA_ID=CAMNT_0048927741 /DNA_START=89 /DNA_END=874 /DNA_ORIENTATION=+